MELVMKFFSFILILTFLLMANIAFALTNVTVHWEMNETTGVTGYKMYYSSSPDMANKTWHQECDPPKEDSALSFTMLCNNMDIDITQTTYFTIASVTADGEVESDVNTITFPTTSSLSIVQDFRIETESGTESVSSFNIAINFQPDMAEIPLGYQKDSGGEFNTTAGFGWTQPPASLGTRDRDNAVSPDQAYDTLIHVQPEAVWELAVENGTYRITICMGDPSYPIGTPLVRAEGVTVISGQTLSTSNPWIEKSADIQVLDGHLSITFSGSTDPARLCWIRVASL